MTCQVHYCHFLFMFHHSTTKHTSSSCFHILYLVTSEVLTGLEASYHANLQLSMLVDLMINRVLSLFAFVGCGSHFGYLLSGLIAFRCACQRKEKQSIFSVVLYCVMRVLNTLVITEDNGHYN